MGIFDKEYYFEGRLPMIIFDQSIKSTFELAAETVDVIIDILRDQFHMDKAVLFRVSFMLREIINNAVEHGNQFDENKSIHIQVAQSEDRFIFAVEDQGEGFVLKIAEQIPDHHLRVRNRGIYLIKEFGFDIEVKDQRVVVHMPYEANS